MPTRISPRYIYGIQLGSRLMRSAADRVCRAALDGLQTPDGWTPANVAYVEAQVRVLEAELKTIRDLLKQDS